MNKLQKIDVVVARMLVMCVFMPYWMQAVVAAGTCVYFAARTLRQHIRPRLVNYAWALVLGGSYFLFVMAAFITPLEHRANAAILCERMVSFLLMPVVFATMGQYYRQLIAGQLRFFVYGCLIVSLIGNLDFLYQQYIVDGGREALSHVRYRTVFEPFTGVHPTYMGVYLAFAMCITGIVWQPLTMRDRVLRNITLYTLLVFLLALFAKSPIIALGVIACHFLYQQRGQLRRYAGAAAVLCGVVVSAIGFIPFIRQRAGEMLGLFGDAGTGNITQNSVHTRRLIWDTDMALLQHYWLGGTAGRLYNALNYRYFFSSIYRGYDVGYFDPHSQYFYFWLSFGLVGIAALLGVLVVHICRAVVAGNNLYLYLMLILVITFFTETLLARQHGVLFYAIFTSLFFFLNVIPASSSRERL